MHVEVELQLRWRAGAAWLLWNWRMKLAAALVGHAA
jgi:hypothetical protein